MSDINIRRFHARYHLPDLHEGDRHRLDRILELTLEETLEAAVAEAGVSSREEICIRRLFVPVQLRLTGNDHGIAEQWAKALATIMKAAVLDLAPTPLADGSLIQVIRYESRAHAILDMAIGIAASDLSNSWAWSQLGLWRGGEHQTESEAVQQFVHALAREPWMILPVFKTLAGRAKLVALLTRLQDEHWVMLADAALARAGAALSCDDLRRVEASGQEPNPIPPALASLAGRLLIQSLMARALDRAQKSPSVIAAMAALILLEVEPILAQRQKLDVLRIIRAISTVLDRVTSRASSIKHDLLREERVSAVIELGEELAAPESWQSGELKPSDFRSRAFTRNGGLLFLLNVLEHLSIPTRIPDAFPKRSFCWVLHQLGKKLVRAPQADAATLAFAGLPPDSREPDEADCPVDADEQHALLKFLEEVIAELQHRLGHLRLQDAALLEMVCGRRAQIIADPGWIEIHFSLEDVSTDIRRAALDLDPGYLPWLGAVVKFVYE